MSVVVVPEGGIRPMARGVDGETFRQVRMLFEAGAVGGLSDGQLLERFRVRVGPAAESAFSALVARHGTMVLRVCRRTLRDEHDAQDAFQATFLVLVRKANSLSPRGGDGDSLGPWLHAVACRVAACARSAAARRRSHERRAAEATGRDLAARGGDWDDLGQVLHEEIDRLPGTYRAAVVLCDLEGLTQEQAAQRLGWPSGTVRSRLARGRGRLQARLTRRGLAPSTGALAAILAADAATAGVPATLAESTVRAAMGPLAAGTIPALALTEGVLKAMFLTKIKWITTTLLALGAGAVGPAVLALQPRPAGDRSGGVTIAAKARSAPGGAGALDRAEADSPSGPGPTAEDPQPRVSQAEADMKVAENRHEWANRMLQKGYISISEHLDAARDVKRARLALEEAREESPGASAQDPPEVIEARISLAEFDLKRAEDRLAWAERMVEKGYYSRSQLIDDRLAVEKLRLALELARKERIPSAREAPPGDAKAGERDRDEAARLAKEAERLQAEMKAALLRYERIKVKNENESRLRDRRPGPLTEAERDVLEAEAAHALAEVKLKAAELRLLSLRLEQAKN